MQNIYVEDVYFKKGEISMKKITILVLFMFLLFITGCNSKNDDRLEEYILERPEDYKNELWICDDVIDFEFKGYDPIYGWFGAFEYLDKNYKAAKDETGNNIRPVYYVTYVITNYPDYSSKAEAVTRLIITDPNVSIYGLNINSSVDDFTSKFDGLGFKIDESGFYRRGKIRIRFEKDSMIGIYAEVTNKDNIIF